MFEFKFPDIGEGITEGHLLKWKVKVGDKVKQDQNLAEIETDKAVADIPSPVSGTVLKLHFKEHETIKVGDILITIADKGEKEIKKEAIKKSVSVVGELEESEEEIPKVKQVEQTSMGKILALPSVRKLAKDLNLDLAEINGSGKNGMITKSDIENLAKQENKKTEIKIVKKYDFYGYVERIPLQGIRKTIAKNMSQSYSTIPHVTHTDEADVTELVKLREKEKLNAEKRNIKLTFLPFIMKAIILSLKNHPYVNSSLEQEEIILKKYYNIGFAVDTPDGLLVPVIKNADSKSILEIAKEIDELAEKAKTRKIDLGDLKGSTFTITNVGSLGGIYSTPIINYPECAILALGKIKKQPKIIDFNIRIRDVLPLSFTFDHRIIDGAEAAKFVNDMIKMLEDPDLLLLE
nr:2-oxo acid dehydrogenase subunit E2 [Candidatus Woesearchaeota archaeon]